MAQTKEKFSLGRINHLIFWPPFVLLVAVVVISLIDADFFSDTLNGVYAWILDGFSWLYAAIALLCVIVCVVSFCTSAGKIRFGGKEAKPKYSFFQWFAMCLCGGIAIGIVFWGVAEPITFLSDPPHGYEPFGSDAAEFALSQSMYHWSFTPYAIYAVATIPVALAVYNFGQKMTISSGLYFLLGEKCNGVVGKVANIVALFALVGGIATSMGLGVMQITSGLSFVTGIEPSVFVWAIVALFILVAFTFSSVIGIDKGLKWLADQNVKLYAGVLFFILLVGPTTFILNGGFEAFCTSISGFLDKTGFLGSFSGETWAQSWTVFYWAVWIAYAPVVGIFLTRLCYGRTLREFLLANLVGPALFGVVWFAVFGGAAIDMQLNGGFDIAAAISANGVESAVFMFFSEFPLGEVLVIVFLVVIIISFVTMADSMTSVAAIMSTTGFSQEEGEPPMVLKVVWGVVMGALAWVMISFAGLDGARIMANIASFPLLFLMAAFIASAIKGLFFSKGS